MSDLIFIDTETTGLSMDADIWEFAGIRRGLDYYSESLHLFIEHDWKKCAELPESFRCDHEERFPGHNLATSRHSAAHQISQFVNARDGMKPHIVGAVPDFDAYRLAKMISDQIGWWTPTWHYHLIDVENLAAGWLAARGSVIDPPWDSNALSASIGIDPDRFERHTAMGDVLWAQAIYDAVMRADS